MLSKNIDKIEESDLQELITNKVRERKTLEYKQPLPSGSDNDKKEFLADKSLEINPNRERSWNNKAHDLIKLRKYDEATLCLDKLLKINSNAAMAYYNKACIEAIKNNKIQALELLKKATELEPKFKERAKNDSDFNGIKNEEEFTNLIQI